MKIEYFVPESIKRNIKTADVKFTNKNQYFTFSGKASLYYILKSFQVKKIMLPAYLCGSVLKPIYDLKIEPVFYDINITDLNPSYDSIVEIHKESEADCILVPSLYGFPSDIEKIEKYCKANNIILVDDAAQSAGVKVNKKYLGTFGNAGFISFSPGKNTTAPYGSIFWIEKSIKINYTKSYLLKEIRKLQYYYCRVLVYKKISTKRFRYYINKITDRFEKKDDYNIKLGKKEKKYLLYNLEVTINNINYKRKKYFNEFCKKKIYSKYFRIIKNEIGESYPSKIVLLFTQKNKAIEFIIFLKEKNIRTRNGYKLLTYNLDKLPNTKKIENCVVELPLELNENRMKYLFESVKEYVNRENNVKVHK